MMTFPRPVDPIKPLEVRVANPILKCTLPLLLGGILVLEFPGLHPSR